MIQGSAESLDGIGESQYPTVMLVLMLLMKSPIKSLTCIVL